MPRKFFSTSELQARWNSTHDAERKIYRKTNGKTKKARAPETILTLGIWYFETGNEAFAEAIRAAQGYGFDSQTSGTLKQARNRAKGYNEEIYLASMQQLLRSEPKRKRRNAAAHVAVYFAIPGQTFTSVIRRLENAYDRRHPKKGQTVRTK